MTSRRWRLEAWAVRPRDGARGCWSPLRVTAVTQVPVPPVMRLLVPRGAGGGVPVVSGLVSRVVVGCVFVRAGMAGGSVCVVFGAAVHRFVSSRQRRHHPCSHDRAIRAQSPAHHAAAGPTLVRQGFTHAKPQAGGKRSAPAPWLARWGARRSRFRRDVLQGLLCCLPGCAGANRRRP